MIMANIGVALTQLGEGREAVASHEAARALAEERGLFDAADQARTHVRRPAREHH